MKTNYTTDGQNKAHHYRRRRKRLKKWRKSGRPAAAATPNNKFRQGLFALQVNVPATQNEGSSAVNTMVSSTGNLDEHQATQKEGSQPSTPRTRSRLRATATTLPQRRPASRHALINIMSPEKQMDNNFQLIRKPPPTRGSHD